MAAIAIAAYVVALAWTVPAGLAIPRAPAIVGTGGTVWHGSATLADGSLLGWRWAPLRSLVSLGFAADWTVTGAGVDLVGRAVLHRHSIVVDETSGGATGSLLALALPDLPFTCAMPLQVVLDRMAIGGADQALRGEVRAGAGSCAARSGGPATLLPPLAATFGRLGRDSEIMLAPSAARRRLLVHGTLAPDGHLRLEVTRDGGRMLPFAAPPGGMAIDTTL